MAAYRIGEDQVRGSLHCGIVVWHMTATGLGRVKMRWKRFDDRDLGEFGGFSRFGTFGVFPCPEGPGVGAQPSSAFALRM
jgi:hypothetical protein